MKRLQGFDTAQPKGARYKVQNQGDSAMDSTMVPRFSIFDSRTGGTRKMKGAWGAVLRCGFVLLAALILLSLPAPMVEAQADGGEVFILTAEGPITPALGDYLERGLDRAEAAEAELLVLRLDTPGGSVQVMGNIVRSLSNAAVPTLVYIWPSGGQAASAGTFLTLSADLAAMAPNTTIGAASVVGGGGEEVDETMQRKISNDLRAMIRAQAEDRGPEAVEWAEAAITEAVAANANEALAMNVVDFIAVDTSDLLRQADGRTVTLADGEERTLNVAQAPLRDMPMGWIQRLLHIITDPNIALMLVSLGGIALFYELTSPGGYIGGIFGIIATLLGFYALGSLDANWVGLALIFFSMILFFIEIKTAVTGLFAAGGLAAFVAGALLLFQGSYAEISLPLVLVMAAAVALFFVVALAAVMRSRNRPSVTGQEGLIGAKGEVRSPVGPDQTGIVLALGERWQATAATTLVEGDKVRVVAVDGLHISVEPLRSSGPSGSDTLHRNGELL